MTDLVVIEAIFTDLCTAEHEEWGLCAKVLDHGGWHLSEDGKHRWQQARPTAEKQAA